MGIVGFAQGQVVTDGTVGDQQQLQGPNFRIHESLGSRAGNNLFHSFSTFNIFSGESALFTGSADIENVISRVTGNDASVIQGLLKSEVGNADFFFINPNGVIFGEGAKVDVPAAFHVSTAQTLIFNDGSQFSSDLDQSSSLSVAPPESFGFVGASLGKIVFENSNIKLDTGGTSSFSASDIEIKSSEVKHDGGKVSFVAVGSDDATLSVRQELYTGNGSIEIKNSDIKVEGEGENELQILSKDVEIKDSFLSVVNDGADDNESGLHVNADKIEIKDSHVSLATTGAGSSGSINITANSLELKSASDGTGTRLSIESRSDSGQAGDINLTINNELTLGSNTEVINQVRFGGQGGDINITAGSLSIDTGTSAASSSLSTFTDGDGDAGDIVLNINGAIELIGNAQINASTLGNGDAGDVVINANSMLIEENENTRDIEELVGIQSLSGLQTEIANAPQGNSGSITINLAEDLTLLNGGQIVSITVGDGNSGDIIINAQNLVLDSGEERERNVIGSNTLGPTASGDAGDIYINVSEDFEMFGNTFVTTGSVSEGNAGNMQIRAGNLLMLGNGGRSAAGINSSTEGPFSSGNAGSIDIRVSGQLVMQAGANITSDTSNNGDAGDVYIEAASISMSADPDLEDTGISSSSTMLDPEDIVEFIFDNIANEAASGVSFEEVAQFVAAIFTAQIDLIDPEAIVEFVNNQFDGTPPQDLDINEVASYISNALTSGNAGDVTLKVAGDIIMQGDVGIATEGESRGNAGNIVIEADSLIMRGGELESKAEGEFLSAGTAGDISIQLSGKLDMTDGAQIASNSINGLDAGDVSISANEIEMQGFGRSGEFSEITSSAALTQGNAGNISLTVTGDIKMTDGANIVSDSIYAGQAGIINISANNLELNGNGLPTRISSTSINAEGDAGNININVAGDLSLINGGQITSSTLASAGNAGTVNIATNSLYIDGQGNDSLSAYLRYLELQLADEFDELPDEFEVLPEDEGELLLLSSFIDVQRTGLLTTGIESSSSYDALGDAGVINITANDIQIKDSGVINTSSDTTGNAGNISILTERLDINENQESLSVQRAGIYSSVGSTGSGSVGTIYIEATDQIKLQEGIITIDSQARNTAGDTVGNITIKAKDLLVLNGAEISSQSKGATAASNIELDATGTFQLIGAQISTSAEDADAGFISLNADEIFITRSVMTTSVSGDGNGGNIDIGSRFIVLDTGFIQGNTGGDNFSGGNINIGSFYLIVENQNLIANNDTRQVFSPDSGNSVIQAAAPDGVSGNINIGALEFDLSGELAVFNTELLNLNPLQNNPCQTSSSSSLGLSGKGGEPLRAKSLDALLLDENQIKLRLIGNTLSNENGANNNLPPLDTCFTQKGTHNVL